MPSVIVAREAVDFAVVASTDNFGLRNPEQIGKGQQLRGDADYSLWRLIRRGRIDHSDAAIVRDERQSIARWREIDTVHPARSRVQELATDCVEW